MSVHTHEANVVDVLPVVLGGMGRFWSGDWRISAIR